MHETRKWISEACNRNILRDLYTPHAFKSYEINFDTQYDRQWLSWRDQSSRFHYSYAALNASTKSTAFYLNNCDYTTTLFSLGKKIYLLHNKRQVLSTYCDNFLVICITWHTRKSPDAQWCSLYIRPSWTHAVESNGVSRSRAFTGWWFSYEEVMWSLIPK